MQKWQEDMVKYRLEAGEKMEDVYWDLHLQRGIDNEEFEALMLEIMSPLDLSIFLFYNNLNPDLPVENLSAEMKKEIGSVFVKTLAEAKEQKLEGEYIYGYRFAIIGDTAMEEKFETIRSYGMYGKWEKEIEILGVKCKIGFSFGD